MPIVPNAELPLDGLSHRKIGEYREREGSRENSLRRSTSRSSSSSNKSTRRSISRSLSRARGAGSGISSSATRRPPSVQRTPYFGVGAGERGEGVIRTMSRGSRSNEVPGEAQGHYVNGITNPPLYGEMVEEGNGKGQGEEDEEEDEEGGGRSTSSTTSARVPIDSINERGRAPIRE
jgi:hypothetical protein